MSNPKSMALFDHLDEVRSRLILSLVAVGITTTLAYAFSDTILRLLIAPAGEITQLVAFSPMDGFMVRFRVALYGGVVLAAPIWIFHLLRFVTRALKPNEKRLAVAAVDNALGVVRKR